MSCDKHATESNPPIRCTLRWTSFTWRVRRSFSVFLETVLTADVSLLNVALDALTEQTTIALSTHVFYRALENVPQLVRNWYEACKDRQLAMSFIAIVTRHLSPVLIEHEFAVIRQPGVLRTLENDSLSVRVLSASAEITAKYIIDEQPMEIAIKLPQEYPLRNVEVKEVNRVGVTEGKWRGWMLNVQQLVMSRVSVVQDFLKLRL
jgi:hypothetical protein